MCLRFVTNQNSANTTSLCSGAATEAGKRWYLWSTARCRSLQPTDDKHLHSLEIMTTSVGWPTMLSGQRSPEICFLLRVSCRRWLAQRTKEENSRTPWKNWIWVVPTGKLSLISEMPGSSNKELNNLKWGGIQWYIKDGERREIKGGAAQRPIGSGVITTFCK